MNSRALNPVRRLQGQVLILMTLLMTTLIIFFGMVVNIGHLVQAKINLQNAVDLAAMSGASWQARYLNHIALINYRMRQNYKFVLFDIYVTQSRHNAGFKKLRNYTGALGHADKIKNPLKELTLGICQTIPNYVPSTPEEKCEPPADPATLQSARCRDPERRAASRIFSISTDFCKLIKDDGSSAFFSALPSGAVAGAGPFGAAIAAAQAQGNNLLRQNCIGSSGQNEAYFNYIIRHLRERNYFQMEEMARILVRFSRAFSAGAELDPVAGSGEGDQSMLATFKENLITANADGLEEDSLVYLNPPESRAFIDEAFASDPSVLIGENEPGGNFPKYFERQLVGFSLSVIQSEWTGSMCKFSPVFVTAKEPNSPTKPGFVFLGLSRAREDGSGLGESSYKPVKVPFQIALRAKVKPSLLFWPRGLTPTLTAVAVAKPFGSRLAPPLENVNLEVNGAPTKNRVSGVPANISFYPGDIPDGSDRFPGVGHIRILQDLDSALLRPGTNQYRLARNQQGMTPERPSIYDSSFQAPGAERCESNPMPFLCRALAPTLYEGLLWTVFPDPPDALALNPAQVAEYPIEFSLPIGRTGSQPDVTARIRRMGALYNMPDRMPPAANDNRSTLWHVSTLIPQDQQSRYTENGKPLFYATESSAASAFNSDWNLATMESNLGNATDGRRGYQIRLISMEQACEELKQSNSTQIGPAMRNYCEGEGAVYH